MQNSSKQKTNSLYVLKITLVASAGGFLFGFDFVIISGALSFLDNSFHLSAAMKGLASTVALRFRRRVIQVRQAVTFCAREVKQFG